MAQEHVLHIRKRERPLQQRVVAKKNLPDGKIVRGAPVGIDLAELWWFS